MMECWDLYDRSGNRLGKTILRREAIPQGCYHLVSCVVVRHVDGDFLIMRRSAAKKSCPNILEIGVGGCAVQGEDALSCAKRELEEETGIVCDGLSYTGRYVDEQTATIYEGYFCLTDAAKNSIRLQPEENSAFYWYSAEEFLQFFRSDACLDRFKRRLHDFVETFGLQ